MLAFACAFTMFAGAAFTDSADIQAKDAVNMLTSLGVIEGYEDGSFNPDGTVTRAEMAKMIFVVRNNTADDAAYADVTTNLTDINGHWAEGYVKFCESQGIIAGYGDGTFRPDEIVTGTEAAKMLLVLTGYDEVNAGLTGTAWATNTLRHAGAAGILDNVSASLSSGLPRQWAAQMIANTLSADRVVWSSDAQSFDTVLNGGIKETVGRAYMGLYNSIGTLILIDMDNLEIAQNSADENESDPIDTIWDGSKLKGEYATEFSKVGTDYSDLLGQKVRVMFKNGHTNEVLGVFPVEGNTVYTVAANETSKDGDRVSFGGNSYRLDNGNSIPTYIDGERIHNTTLDELDCNALNPNMYTFVDSDGNSRLDTLVVRTYNVAKVTYADSAQIIANGVTYKYDQENIAEDIAKDDWVVITKNLFNDNLDIVAAEMQTGTLTGLRNNNDDKDIYFDAQPIVKHNYNEYQVNDNWYSGGEDAVQDIEVSENDLNAVKASEPVEYIEVNGIMFYIRKTTGSGDGRVDNVALVLAKDNTNVADRVKLAFFDGDTETVTVDSNSPIAASALDEGTVYEYTISGGEYRFDHLECGIEANNGDDRYEGYYGDLTYRGETIVNDNDPADARSIETIQDADRFDTMRIDDDAQILLFSKDTSASSGHDEVFNVAQITGKQLNAMSDLNNIDGKNHGLTTTQAWAFSGDMSGIDRIGALALRVDQDADLSEIDTRTWLNYAYITDNAVWDVYYQTMRYTIWTGTEEITVYEDGNNLDNRQANMVIGFDKLDRSNPDHIVIDEVDVIDNTVDGFAFTAVTGGNSSTVSFANGEQLDISGATILYVNTDSKTGIVDGNIETAQKDPTSGDYMANAIYLKVGDDAALLVVDQTTYYRSDYYKTMVDLTDTIYGGNANAPAIAAPSETIDPAKVGVAYEQNLTFGVTNINNGAAVTYKVDTAIDGLSVDVDTTVSGQQIKATVSGTPTVAGDFEFTVTAGGVNRQVTITVDPADKTVVEQIVEAIETAFPDNANATGSKASPYQLTKVMTTAAEVADTAAFDVDLAKYFEGYTVTAAQETDMNGLDQGYDTSEYALTQDANKITIADGASNSTFADGDQFGIKFTLTEDATGDTTILYALITLDAADAVQQANNAMVDTLTALNGANTSFLHGATAVGSLENVVKLVKDVSTGDDVGTALTTAFDSTKVSVTVAPVASGDKPSDAALTGTFEQASSVALNTGNTAVRVTASTVSTSSAWTAYTLTVSAIDVPNATVEADGATFTVVVYGA